LFEVDNGAWVTQVICCYFIFLLITTLSSLKQPPGMLMTGLQNTEDLGSSHQVLQWHPPTVTSQNTGTPDINTKFVNMHNTPPNAF